MDRFNGVRLQWGDDRLQRDRTIGCESRASLDSRSSTKSWREAGLHTGIQPTLVTRFTASIQRCRAGHLLGDDLARRLIGAVSGAGVELGLCAADEDLEFDQRHGIEEQHHLAQVVLDRAPPIVPGEAVTIGTALWAKGRSSPRRLSKLLTSTTSQA